MDAARAQAVDREASSASAPKDQDAAEVGNNFSAATKSPDSRPAY